MGMSGWQRFRTGAHLFVVGVQRRMVLGARVAIIDGDRVLLLRHTYLPGWHFPGGGVEPGEAAADAGAREMLEETGLQATTQLRLFGLYHNVNEATNRDHLAFFVCRDFREARPFKRNLEIAEVGWFPLDGLPGDADAGALRRIEEILTGTGPAARW
jgi:8-oxo-dGTP pyrophosphatase MutT (NUDIX family)